MFVFTVCEKALLAEIFKEEGDNEYTKREYDYAIVCYTEGINKSCDNKNCDSKSVKVILFTNRATAHLKLGENFSLFSFFIFKCSLI